MGDKLDVNACSPAMGTSSDSTERIELTGKLDQGYGGVQQEAEDVEHGECDEDEEDDEHPAVLRDGFGPYLSSTLKELALGGSLNILLLCTPFAFVSYYSEWNEAVTFIISLLALCPFAERISFVTEDMSKYTTDTLGGLLNASFGNITELVVSIFALKKGLIRVVQVSMIGSVLSNLLLVLGSAFLAGGFRHKEQKFNSTAAVTNSSMLIVLLFGLFFPALHSITLGETSGVNNVNVEALVANATSAEVSSFAINLDLSRYISILMLILYGLSIFFQLKTHTYMFEGQEEDDDEPPILGVWGGIFWMGFTTFFITFLSAFIVDTIEKAAENLGCPMLWITAIPLPIVGNAAEHAAAIIFGYKNKMDISIGIAVGSAVQIAIFVIPLCVMMGWWMDQPMSLNFHAFETISSLLTCIMVAIMIQDGNSTWLKGAMLVVSYLILGGAFWAQGDDEGNTRGGF